MLCTQVKRQGSQPDCWVTCVHSRWLVTRTDVGHPFAFRCPWISYLSLSTGRAATRVRSSSADTPGPRHTPPQPAGSRQPVATEEDHDSDEKRPQSWTRGAEGRPHRRNNADGSPARVSADARRPPEDGARAGGCAQVPNRGAWSRCSHLSEHPTLLRALQDGVPDPYPDSGGPQGVGPVISSTWTPAHSEG